ncbi:hypothetical protein IAT40_004149 [Kwoniella sp. CBS 6097]
MTQQTHNSAASSQQGRQYQVEAETTNHQQSGWGDWQDPRDEAAFSEAAADIGGSHTPTSGTSGMSPTTGGVPERSRNPYSHSAANTSPATSHEPFSGAPYAAPGGDPTATAAPHSWGGDYASRYAQSSKAGTDDETMADAAKEESPPSRQEEQRPPGSYYKDCDSEDQARQLNGDYMRPAHVTPNSEVRSWTNCHAKDNASQINGDCFDPDFFHRW